MNWAGIKFETGVNLVICVPGLGWHPEATRNDFRKYDRQYVLSPSYLYILILSLSFFIGQDIWEFGGWPFQAGKNMLHILNYAASLNHTCCTQQ